MPDNLGRFEYGGEGSTLKEGERAAIVAAVVAEAEERMLAQFGLALFPQSPAGEAPAWDPESDIRWGETFAVGDRICVTWVFRGIHIGDPAGSAGEPAAEIREQGRGSGFRSEGAEREDRARREAAPSDSGVVAGLLGTGRAVHVKVISTGRPTFDQNGALEKATLTHSRWDSLSVLGQMGVQAVGRPIGGTRVLRGRA